MKTIALAGKGGTGKTTIAALIIGELAQSGGGPLLAIDADPSSNLHLALGLPMPTTVGEIRESMSAAAVAGHLGVAISRHDHLTHEIFMALEEGEQVDLLAMGRPEGQGCYCAVNHLLRQVLDDLGDSYQYVVVDNEAGMEHISRRTTKGVDLLLIVSDPTVRGLQAATAIKELADEVDVEVARMGLVLNRVQGPLAPPLAAAVEATGLELLVKVPADDQVNELDAFGKPLLQLDAESPARAAVQSISQGILANT
ncbi:MAG: AAA family ATPase [Anaerolineales bacterium]